jgi:hypothetical protein
LHVGSVDHRAVVNPAGLLGARGLDRRQSTVSSTISRERSRAARKDAIISGVWQAKLLFALSVTCHRPAPSCVKLQELAIEPQQALVDAGAGQCGAGGLNQSVDDLGTAGIPGGSSVSGVGQADRGRLVREISRYPLG